MGDNGASADRDRVLEELRAAQRLIVVAHEHPDGDALGSLIGMQGALAALGKDCLMFIDSSELPLPQEYRFLSLSGLVSSPPDDLDERTIVFLDCGNLERNPADALQRPGMHILNIDHHHDNTHFGTVNLVVPDASCTAEIVWDLMKGLGIEPTQEIAEALYVGLITDTGRFMYENTGPRAHRMAAELIAVGVDVAAVNTRLYENMPHAKLLLLGVALARIQRFDGGALTLVALDAADFEALDAEESLSEGIIDQLRSIAGTKVAVLVRELLGAENRGKHKVSLRATGEDVDVSAIARTQGGGGHRRAAGFSTTASVAETIELLRHELALQLERAPDGPPLATLA